MVGLPTSISGFTILPVSYSADTTHVIYIRPHTVTSPKAQGKLPAWPKDRTLFMVNLPPDATERDIILLFKTCGTVERVVFDSDAGADELGQDEESGSDADSGYGDEEESDGEASDGAHPRKKRKLDKNAAKDDSQPPRVVSLPSPALRTLRQTGHTAHIVFLDPSSLSRALALAHAQPSKHKSKADSSGTGPQARPWPSSAEAPRGLAHYTALYDARRPPLDAVRAHAESAIAAYDHAEGERKRALQRESKYRKGEALVDEDGFTLVTRGGAYGKAVGGGVGVASREFVEEQVQGRSKGKESGTGRKRRKEPKEKDAFYAFQLHEKKRSALMELKRKWEEDKAAVERLKSSRKFKPY